MTNRRPDGKTQAEYDAMLLTCQSQDIGKYNRATAKIFQEMIRAEEGCKFAWVSAVIHGKCYQRVPSSIGMCVCVTCGHPYPWKGTNLLDTGHFLAGRNITYLFEETGVHPQCVRCNRTEGGAADKYELYMWERYGPDEIDRLRSLKADTKKHWWYKADRLTRQKWSVDRRIEYFRRLREAKTKL